MTLMLKQTNKLILQSHRLSNQETQNKSVPNDSSHFLVSPETFPFCCEFFHALLMELLCIYASACVFINYTAWRFLAHCTKSYSAAHESINFYFAETHWYTQTENRVKWCMQSSPPADKPRSCTKQPVQNALMPFSAAILYINIKVTLKVFKSVLT